MTGDMLPVHPNINHLNGIGERPCVLPSGAAELTLEHMELPVDADPRVIYISEAFCHASSPDPFVRAIWYTPEMADALTGRTKGSHLQTTHALHTQGMDHTNEQRVSNNQSAWGGVH